MGLESSSSDGLLLLALAASTTGHKRVVQQDGSSCDGGQPAVATSCTQPHRKRARQHIGCGSTWSSGAQALVQPITKSWCHSKPAPGPAQCQSEQELSHMSRCTDTQELSLGIWQGADKAVAPECLESSADSCASSPTHSSDSEDSDQDCITPLQLTPQLHTQQHDEAVGVLSFSFPCMAAITPEVPDW